MLLGIPSGDELGAGIVPGIRCARTGGCKSRSLTDFLFTFVRLMRGRSVCIVRTGMLLKIRFEQFFAEITIAAVGKYNDDMTASTIVNEF